MQAVFVPTEPSEAVGTGPSLRHADTRFLLPFSFQRLRVDEAVAALTTLVVPRRPRADQAGGEQKPPRPAWIHLGLRDLHNPYVQEATESLQKLLFLDGEAHEREALNGAYLQLNHEVAEAWFGVNEVSLALGKIGGGLEEIPIHLARKSGIELFLSGHGIGVLSLDLEPKFPGLNGDQILRFNYMLSQFRRDGRDLTTFSYPSLSEDAPVGLTPRQRSDGELATSNRRLVERLGLPGVSFTLGDLADELLSPLDSLGPRATQQSLVIYSTLWLSERTTFASDSAARREYTQFMYAASHVHEPGHPGRGEPSTEEAGVILNENHWAALSTHGCVHLGVDQDKEFDRDRLARVRFKYFAVFLAALLQRTFLDHKSSQISSSFVKREGLPREVDAAKENVRDDWLGELKSEVLQFALTADITTASTRSTVQRYYKLSREALGVPEGIDRIKHALSDLHQAQITKVQHHLQKAVHKLEFLGIVIAVASFVMAVLGVVIATIALWHELRNEPHDPPTAQVSAAQQR